MVEHNDPDYLRCTVTSQSDPIFIRAIRMTYAGEHHTDGDSAQSHESTNMQVNASIDHFVNVELNPK